MHMYTDFCHPRPGAHLPILINWGWFSQFDSRSATLDEDSNVVFIVLIHLILSERHFSRACICAFASLSRVARNQTRLGFYAPVSVKFSSMLSFEIGTTQQHGSILRVENMW